MKRRIMGIVVGSALALGALTACGQAATEDGTGTQPLGSPMEGGTMMSPAASDGMMMESPAASDGMMMESPAASQ